MPGQLFCLDFGRLMCLIGDELFGLNHNTFATTRNVLNDLAILLMEGKPPPRLVEIRGFPEPPQKAAYFRYIP